MNIPNAESRRGERRQFVQRIMSGAAFMLASCATAASKTAGYSQTSSAGSKEEVSPAEDLMREHGVLKRVLLIYGEALRRLEANEELPPQALLDSANVIRAFIENYHERLEEDYLFPRFRKANRLVDLVDVLNIQHQAGRRLTDEILKYATAGALKSVDGRRTLSESLMRFIRMYSPHEAREDTVLFPAFRELVSSNEYGALGEEFEKKEHALFGDNGFEAMVDRVATIEKTLGIFDLAQFTPKG
jgi:hemerythrin-like domain-containing protein